MGFPIAESEHQMEAYTSQQKKIMGSPPRPRGHGREREWLAAPLLLERELYILAHEVIRL